MKRTELTFTLALVPLDFLMLLAAGIVAYFSRFHPLFTTVRPVIFSLSLDQYIKIISSIALVWILIFAIAGLYSTRRRIANEILRVALACSTSMATVFAILFFSRVFFESRFIAIAAWLLSIVFISTARVLIRLFQRLLLHAGIGIHRLILIGDSKTAKTLAEIFKKHPAFGFVVVEAFKTFDETVAERIRRLKETMGVDEIILADENASPATSLAILTFTDTEHLGFRYTADFFSSAIGRTILHTFAGIPVIEVQKTPLDGWGAIYKRAFDIVGSVFLLILTLPLQIIVAAALFIEQPGRILFSHLPNEEKAVRVGQNGRRFHYFKFRSMVKDAHLLRSDPNFMKKSERRGPLFKLKDDPRVTKVGKFIRKYSLDELPEFYLVLLGRMSLVGPRPHLPEEVAQYKPTQLKVLTVRPGITGMGQVSGRADIDFDDEVRLDIHYIEHWSPLLDFIILLKTPFVVLFRKGAY